MAVCLILIAFRLLPHLDFSGLSFLGIKPADPGRARNIIFWVLWALWTYHVILFIYYAQRDFKDWKFDLLSSNGKFTELRMYFRIQPSENFTKREYSHLGKLGSWGWNRSSTREVEEWTFHYTPQTGRENLTPLPLAKGRVKSARSRLYWFVFVECGLPLVLSILALATLGHFHDLKVGVLQ